jgi:hypothetical protein
MKRLTTNYLSISNKLTMSKSEEKEILINCKHCDCSVYFTEGRIEEAPGEDPDDPSKKLKLKYKEHYV